MKSFEVESITILQNYIIVDPVLEEEFTINREEFEAWANRNFKMDWGTNSGDSGTMSWTEYRDSEYFEADVVEYVCSRTEVIDTMEKFEEIISFFK